MTPFAATFALNPDNGNGDGFASWSLSDDCWLGVVADAPSSADSASAKTLTAAVAGWLDQRGRDKIASFVSAGGGAGILAEIVTHVSSRMTDADEDYWAAAIFVLTGPAEVHFAGVGDCAAYAFLPGAGVFRHSETTKVGGSSYLPESLSSSEALVSHVAEGVYLGSDLRVFSKDEVVTLARNSISNLLLISDGIEDQLGVSRLLEILTGSESSQFGKAALVDAVSQGPLKDDCTFLGLQLRFDEVEEAEAEDVDLPPAENEPVAEANPVAVSVSSSDQVVSEVPPRRSFARKFFGFVLSLIALAILGFLLWKMVLLYLEESEALEESEKTEEIITKEPEEPGA